MKQILPVFLFAILLAAVSCGSAGETALSTSAPVTEATTAETADSMMPPDTANYEGREFRVVTASTLKYIYSEEQSGALIGDAQYARDLAVKDALNCEISYQAFATINEVYPAVKTAVMAGDHAYDLIVSHVNWELTSYVANNIVLDWNTVPHVDLTKPYWNQNVIETLSIGGKSPYAASDLFMADTVFLLYNKELAQKLQLGSLYDDVYDGTWTWDRLAEITASVTRDLNGDGKFEEHDQYGIGIDVAGSSWLLRNIPSSCGQLIYEQTEDGLKLAVHNEKTITILEKACALFNGGGGYLRQGTEQTNAEAAALFGEGNYLTWFVSMLNSASLYNNLTFDYGVLPLPKYDEAQENYTTLSWSHNLMIPSTADPGFSGMVTEWMSYYGNKLVRPKFYDSLLSVRFAQDEETIEMLDIIYNGIIYDPGMNFKSNSFYYYFDDMVIHNNTNFESFYTRSLKKEQIYIDLLNKSFAAFGG